MTMLMLEGKQLKIFPVRNRKPACRHGFKDATSDPAEIAALFGDAPGAQIAVATGQVNDLDILDIDLKRGGDQWLEENRWRIPETREHRTPSGGWHLLFRHAGGLRCSYDRIASGVEVKATGGLVVWWPSQGWPVQEAEVAAWPEWLLAELAKGASPSLGSSGSSLGGDAPFAPEPTRSVGSRATRILTVVQGARPGDGRNKKLHWGACRFAELIAEGVVKREAAEFMLLGVAKCNGHVAKHGLKQTKATIRSGLNSTQSTQGLDSTQGGDAPLAPEQSGADNA
jgi:hypothetical protein